MAAAVSAELEINSGNGPPRDGDIVARSVPEVPVWDAEEQRRTPPGFARSSRPERRICRSCHGMSDRRLCR
jgi:hypothetical protein